MGTIAARNTAWQLSRLWELLAIQSLAFAQAAELRAAGEVQDPAASRFSDSSRELINVVRSGSPSLTDDRPLADEIQGCAAMLRAYAIGRFAIT